MSAKVKVRKASGDMQAFSEDKLRNSLQRSGASDVLIDGIVDEIQKQLHEGITTKEIYKKAFQLLRKRVRANAARYSLKKAIMELGPTGFPFERFIGEILKKQGYIVEVGKTIQGKCVQHEVDVVAEKEDLMVMAECKYHNAQGKICSVQVPLYIQSRFHDIETVWSSQKSNENKRFHGWVVTNTRFSSDAEEYGTCAGLRLIGWDFPRKGSLKEMIETSGLFPITVITSLNSRQKQQLLEKNIVLCSDLCSNPGLLAQLNLDKMSLAKVTDELNDICATQKSS
jgi:Holliday junction resolvase-like predicted endonuclease